MSTASIPPRSALGELWANIAQSPRELTDALGITEVFDPGGLQRQLLLGSDVVGEEVLIRFYLFHVMLLPLALGILLAVHFWRIRKDGGLVRPADADRRLPPEPGLLPVFTEAPWYFLGLQELVSFSAFMGGIGIPALVLVGLGLIPFLDREESGTGQWFGGPGGPRLAGISAAFGLAAVLGIEAAAIRFGWLREWFPGIPQWVITAINPGTVLAAHFCNPARVVPGSQMPALGLSREQIDLLVLSMLALRRSDVPEGYWPQHRLRAERLGQREFATDGATLYGTFCAACHGQHGEGRRYPGQARPRPAVLDARVGPLLQPRGPPAARGPQTADR